jgi:hypothetical protein
MHQTWLTTHASGERKWEKGRGRAGDVTGCLAHCDACTWIDDDDDLLVKVAWRAGISSEPKHEKSFARARAPRPRIKPHVLSPRLGERGAPTGRPDGDRDSTCGKFFRLPSPIRRHAYLACCDN